MAEVDLRALVAPLNALRADVEAAYQRLDIAWKAIIEELSKAAIPCTLTHVYREDDFGRDCSCLEWRKWKGSRRFCITHRFQTPDGRDESDDITPFEEWSVEQRVEMLEHVPEFIKTAAKQVGEFVARVQGI